MPKKITYYRTDYVLSFIALMVVGGLCFKGAICIL